jgi:hypothetical protein
MNRWAWRSYGPVAGLVARSVVIRVGGTTHSTRLSGCAFSRNHAAIPGAPTHRIFMGASVTMRSGGDVMF